jgi:hypothetical protein
MATYLTESLWGGPNSRRQAGADPENENVMSADGALSTGTQVPSAGPDGNS